MKKKVVLLTFVIMFRLIGLSLFVVGLLELHACRVYASPHTNIDADTAYNMIMGGGYPDLVVLDVRTKSEYDSGHIYGAVWIHVTELEARIDELAGHENHEIIVYCGSGGRSVTASNILDSHGFTKVYNMLGGISAWQSVGYPVWIATVHNVNTTFSYDTIQAAIDAPQTLNGHTIIVEARTYYERVDINKTVLLIGENEYNTVIDGSGTGTAIEVTCNNVNISGFTIRNSGDLGCGVLVDGSSGNNISHNIVTSNYYGIRLANCTNNVLDDNNVSNNEYGILVDSSGNSVLTNNTMWGNAYNFGLRGAIEPHFNNSVDESNTVDSKPVYYVKRASNIVYDSSTNAGTLYLMHCTNVTIRNLTLTKNVNGIIFWNTTNSNIKNVNISNNMNGIYFQGQSEYNNLTDSTISNNDLGIYLNSSNNSVIYHNSIIENTIQAKVTESYKNLWSSSYPSGGNYWSNHSIRYPFIADEYKGENQNELGNDNIIDDPKIIDEVNQDNYPLVTPLSHPVYNIYTHLSYTTIQEAINASHTLNGHTIIVHAGTYSEQVIINKSLNIIGIIGSTAINGNGTVVTITANNVTLRGFTIKGNGSSATDKAILLSHSNNTITSENTLGKKGYGIYLNDSDCCTISGNTMNNNTIGIHLQSSDNNTISRNTLTSARQNSCGIFLDQSSDNDIHRNNVTYNDVGAKLWLSGNNMIYHNSFINNTIRQVNNEPFGYANTWNNSYPSGGNYWSDYSGVDFHSGFHQNETGSDGIGDTPYGIDENNWDSYPVMSPRTPQHDVAVIEVVYTGPSRTYEVHPVSIYVIVENQGDYTEKFNVTVYSNDTYRIVTQTVTVASENLTPINLTCSAIGVPHGNYTMSVYATPILGETDTTDNSYSDGWVEVRVWGDVNGNGGMDLGDVGKLDLIYSGWIIGPPYVDPKTGVFLMPDLNGDGGVGLGDVGKMDLIYSGHL